MSSRKFWRKRSVDLFNADSSSSDDQIPAIVLRTKRKRRTLSITVKKHQIQENKENVPSNRLISKPPLDDEIREKPACCLSLIAFKPVPAEKFVYEIWEKTNKTCTELKQLSPIMEISKNKISETTLIKKCDEQSPEVFHNSFEGETTEAIANIESSSILDREIEEFESASKLMIDVLGFFQDVSKPPKTKWDDKSLLEYKQSGIQQDAPKIVPTILKKTTKNPKSKKISRNKTLNDDVFLEITNEAEYLISSMKEVLLFFNDFFRESETQSKDVFRKSSILEQEDTDFYAASKIIFDVLDFFKPKFVSSEDDHHKGKLKIFPFLNYKTSIL